MKKTVFVTGGAGFIGSALVRHIITDTDWHVVNIDKLTYAGNLTSLESVSNCERYAFERHCITDRSAMDKLFEHYNPHLVMHLAAESHVDRSIDGPAEFINTNIVGTYTLLEASRRFWEKKGKPATFRFHHISTDEVYGDLPLDRGIFTESTRYDPSSPYSASKASSDHLVRAWNRTYDLPVVVTNCSNNYGPFHYPEKLIPLTIINCLKGKIIPVYGDGKQVRDWLYVEDHARALFAVAIKGIDGETYNIGGNNEKRNIEVVNTICALLEEYAPSKPNGIAKYSDLIEFVTDRPGHDLRYAIDASKLESSLGIKPAETFESGMRKTVLWFLKNKNWWEDILNSHE